MLAHLAKHGFAAEYVAIDISSGAIDHVRSRGDIPGLTQALALDGPPFPFLDVSFDVAVLSHVVEHLGAPAKLVKKSARVARYLVVEVPLENNLYTRFKTGVLGGRYREVLGHVQWFGWGSFRAFLEGECDLEVLHMRATYPPTSTVLHGRRGLRALLGRSRMAMRHAVESAVPELYLRLFTVHCVALVRLVGIGG